MHCANPECSMESDYLRSGTLYWIEDLAPEGEERRGRYIWLCSGCSARFVVQSWRPPGQQLQPAANRPLQVDAACIPTKAAKTQPSAAAQALRKS